MSGQLIKDLGFLGNSVACKKILLEEYNLLQELD